jgi:hypothetical protein
MKQLVKNLFSKRLLEPVLVVFGLIGILQWIVFPGLSELSIFLNVVAGLVGILSATFVVLYVKEQFFPSEKTPLTPGETELDYVPVKPKRTRKPKTTNKKSVKPKITKTK